MGNISGAVLAIVGGFVGLAIVAVIVGQNAQTSNVLKSGGSALAQIIGAAVGPVSGGNMFGSGTNVVPGVST